MKRKPKMDLKAMECPEIDMIKCNACQLVHRDMGNRIEYI